MTYLSPINVELHFLSSFQNINKCFCFSDSHANSSSGAKQAHHQARSRQDPIQGASENPSQSASSIQGRCSLPSQGPNACQGSSLLPQDPCPIPRQSAIPIPSEGSSTLSRESASACQGKPIYILSRFN